VLAKWKDVRVARTENDSWEITESVGATALGVASARAAETRSENPLIRDPFAQVFLDAAGDGVWNWHAAGQLPDEVVEAEPTLPLQMQAMVGYMASRTAFFDTFFLEATGAGIRQAVILAAGLDARSWRLPWPAGTTWCRPCRTRYASPGSGSATPGRVPGWPPCRPDAPGPRPASAVRRGTRDSTLCTCTYRRGHEDAGITAE